MIFFVTWVIALIFSYLLNMILGCFKNVPRAKRVAGWIEAKLKWNFFFDLIFAS